LSVYLLGGEPGVPEAAAENLVRRYRGLKVAGTDSPTFGFDKSPIGMAAVREHILDAAPNIIYVGLGFPKQERVIRELVPVIPGAWFIGCGAAIPFAAGRVPRAPAWMQRSSLEWVHRLAIEPRRLSKRYLLHDLPYGLSLLISAVFYRIGRSLK
jgi:N-acetylglucosaminyldiphosphoundecaprenol N-acetyl-beta-D-mannosaminyltransferase